MRWDVWIQGKAPTLEFNEDDRYKMLIKDIKDGNDVFVTSIRFCDHEFLCKAEYYLKVEFPDLQIDRYYLENNPEGAISNVMYRDKLNGGEWRVVEDGRKIYFGDHHNGVRCYDIGIENVKRYSPNYIIPKKYKAIPIKVMKNG